VVWGTLFIYLWCLFFLTLLFCISCHMHHGLYITLMHLCTQYESEKSSKCVIGIWGLHKRQSTHLGGVSFSNLLNTHIFYKNKLWLSSITTKGEIESASWPLIVLVIMTSTICGIWCFVKMCAGLKWMKLIWLIKGRPPISSRCFQLESRLYFILLLNLSIGNTVI
jgi:hypothetical protein